ncbi:hypothetical protein EW146_g8678 [Bondarzewia mesenterica]|uniref:Aminopeptidase P N-terminal domain-containing protein n=1 Tax=Bondarzewia mesenterica TaxID=1095465 RepID=A0A4S4LCQ4_9AGAM|nr:hypothetical protein EW146_g8678 [Bondarzewia mesenterica]
MSVRSLTSVARRALSSSSLPRCTRPFPCRTYATELDFSTVPKPSKFGQPTFQSHPYLVQPQETTPGIPAREYERRRVELMESLPDGSLVVSVSGQVKYMSGAIFYKFRQASDFWYLTGFEEPDSAVILRKDHSPRGYSMTLYSGGQDPAKEQWDGARTPFVDVTRLFGADDACLIDRFSTDLKALLPTSPATYVDLPPSARRERASRGSAKSLLKYLAGSADAVPRVEFESVLESLAASKRRPLAPLVAKLRSVKSKTEVAVMRAAADISGRAHAKVNIYDFGIQIVMSYFDLARGLVAQPGLSESELAAHFEYLCARSGSQRPAYVPVVASGTPCSSIFIIITPELQLIQPSPSSGYASDITRTFPVNGTFTPAQRELYAALLSAQKSLVALCAATHGFSMNDLHRKSVELLRTELTQIGFHLGTSAGILERVLYPHYLSHPIGVDLHESSGFDRSDVLKEGMVITIEPGVYVPPDPAFPKHFHGLGIRIEVSRLCYPHTDEVLIGETDPTVLSVAAPKEIEDVEGACQGLLSLEPF